jgi:hypothetical protein
MIGECPHLGPDVMRWFPYGMASSETATVDLSRELMQGFDALSDKGCLLCSLIFSAAVALSCVSSSAQHVSAEVDCPTARLDTKTRAGRAALRAASEAASAGFRVSLEMKENVDFLLAPAMSTREAMVDGKTNGRSTR